MALRRCDMPIKIVDRENMGVIPKKGVLQKQQTLPTRRPALNDLGNKLNAQQTLDLPGQKLTELAKKPSSTVTQNDLLAYSTKQLQIADVDRNTKNEPQMVSEYVSDIFEYLRTLEEKYEIKKDYLKEDHRTSIRMRAILINWIVQVHHSFNMLIETLHLCVGIVDRYLQDHQDVGGDTLQLVGTAALMIAAKYEEQYAPEVEEFAYICDDAFTKKQILLMEIRILNKLDHSLGRPPPIHFLRRYNKIAQVKIEHHNLAKYILDLALVDYNSCHHRPSVQAAAACCLSITIINDNYNPSKEWTPTLVQHTSYKYSDIKSLLYNFASLIIKSENGKNQAVREKYASPSFGKISLHPKLKGRLIKKLAENSIKNS